jgi:hypothetical protein
LTHLWQRFLLASSLLVGLLIGVAVTVFGYGNKTAVDLHWSIFHIDGVPLWMVAVVPVAVVLVAGTVYHWMDGLHHFSEHMRHRHRVHELEDEVKSLKAHLDQVLEMPDHATSVPAIEPAAQTTPDEPRRFSRPKRVALTAVAEHVETTAVPTNGGHETAATESTPKA